MLFPSGSSFMLLRQLGAFLWLSKVGLGFSQEESSSLVMEGGRWCTPGGKMGNAEHLPARDASTISSASPASLMLAQTASWQLKLHSSGQISAPPVPRASSALFSKVDMSGWVDDEASCPAAGSTSAATVPRPYAAWAPWWRRAAFALSWPCEGHKCLGFGGGSCRKAGRRRFLGGIFCFGCVVNSNNMSFIAQNISTFMGCYI